MHLIGEELVETLTQLVSNALFIPDRQVTDWGALLFSKEIRRLQNLVANALNYSQADDGPVRIEVAEQEDAWVIRVRDQGPGIASDQVEFIGEPFYRGDPSRTRHTGGSGLGLYIAKLVAEAHGGTLELDQSVERGACFVVTFPFEPDEQTPLG